MTCVSIRQTPNSNTSELKRQEIVCETGCIDDENWKTKADFMMIKTLGRRHLVFVIYCGVGTAANSGA